MILFLSLSIHHHQQRTQREKERAKHRETKTKMLMFSLTVLSFSLSLCVHHLVRQHCKQGNTCLISCHHSLRRVALPFDHGEAQHRAQSTVDWSEGARLTPVLVEKGIRCLSGCLGGDGTSLSLSLSLSLFSQFFTPVEER